MGENIQQLLLTKITTSLFTLQKNFSKYYFREVNRAALCSAAVTQTLEMASVIH